MKKIPFVVLICCFLNSADAQDSVKQVSTDTTGLDWEVFPILSYDTDAGIGYGFKGYIRNIFKGFESYDIILYNSSKGERWYRFQFSYPDYEIRQGKDYGYAVDLIVDFDKWITYYFYGIGNSSLNEDRKLFTQVPFEFNIIINRTISEIIIIQTGLKYKTVSYNDFPFQSLPAGYSFTNKVNQLSFLINAIYDTRNSIINPDKGITFTAGFESSPSFSFVNSSLSRAQISFQSYNMILEPGVIIAERISMQQLIGNGIPVQFLLPLGGGQTLRGFPENRFLDRSSTLINIELRFPIWLRLGGIAGLDAGRVFPSVDRFTFSDWKISPVAGLRLYLNNFILRADLGLSNETVGFYLNFGHIF